MKLLRRKPPATVLMISFPYLYIQKNMVLWAR